MLLSWSYSLFFNNILQFRLTLSSVVQFLRVSMIFVALIDLSHVELLAMVVRNLDLELRVDKDHPIAHKFEMIRQIPIAAFEHIH